MNDPYCPSVSIIIPTWQGASHLAQVLPALRTQDYAGSIEIVAIDSESTDQTVALLTEYAARIQIIPKASFGHGSARNLGTRLATGDVLIFLSQDALPIGRDWLQTLVETVRDQAVGAAYARQIARPDATPLETFFHLDLYPPDSQRYQLAHLQASTLARIFFSNVCSVARREVCLRFPFDESLIMSEDQAFARALLRAGYTTVYQAGARVCHSHHYDLKTFFRRNFDSAYSLRGVATDSLGAEAIRGVGFIVRESRYLIEQRKPRWLLYLPIYEATRIMGRLAGKCADRLPRGWQRTLSLHRAYWKKGRAN